ncbi:MAG: sensor domain-containing diguanylate cyclase [Kiritimatiellae bacterium]|jgi:diguanylate cyclase (GGDEF)-like protein|nr:sensor domain-containing diguanylate cyclase [Kiritimatiellia bacterium]
MQTPEIPETEIGRLNTLKSLTVLDTEEEERFNRITRIAKKTFDTPIALVSLIDENRQWFKSSLGLDVRHTSRDVSFCGHAILKNEILVVPNALEDSRFADNPVVTGDPNIRFYAGCPLTVLNARIGTLCIIDTKPREISEDELMILKDLSALVESELLAHHLSTMDELTKVLNRRGLISLIQNGIDLCAEHKISSTLVFFDLNGFKKINDNYGHKEGDLVLKLFAGLIEKASRSGDVIGRLGGDEFVAWLSNSTMETAQSYTERINKLISDHNISSGNQYKIAFSSGVVLINPDCRTSIDDLLHEADTLMYHNKNKK